MRKFLGTLALIAFGFGLALGIADIGIRIANHWFPYFYCYDAIRGWGLNPGAHGWYDREGESYVRINADGFRGADYVRPKPPGVIRVAVLGDSYVEAIQVAENQTFTSVIGRQLAGCPELKDKRIEALNFGVDGYGTAQELFTLKNKVWSYQPDIVVLAIFLGNDIRNNSVVLEPDQCRPFFVYDHDQLKLTGPFENSPTFKLWCMARFGYRDLRLLDLFTNTWEIIRSGHGGPTANHPEERAINYSIYSPPTEKSWQDAWKVTEGLIAATHDEVAKHGAMFLAVTEDTGIQVWPDPSVSEKFAHHLHVADLFYPDRRIAALGQRDGFAVLTLAEPLAQYAQKHHVFLHGFDNTPTGFGHWNATGHAQAGALITQKLCSMIEAGDCRECSLPAEAKEEKRTSVQ
ncbi:MAG TPA: SGNH/GDSL hydrolase family protein [Candidatus Binataceae bacterium]|nr:SGNH/GDSL hydrolase family protein [Candidatus Binataceae bacterium]